jgi:hypothetical protein
VIPVAEAERFFEGDDPFTRFMRGLRDFAAPFFTWAEWVLITGALGFASEKLEPSSSKAPLPFIVVSLVYLVAVTALAGWTWSQVGAFLHDNLARKLFGRAVRSGGLWNVLALLMVALIGGVTWLLGEALGQLLVAISQNPQS